MEDVRSFACAVSPNSSPLVRTPLYEWYQPAVGTSIISSVWFQVPSKALVSYGLGVPQRDVCIC